MPNRSPRIWMSWLVAVVIASTSIGQTPPLDNTKTDMEWGEYLAQHPDVMGVHLARLNKTIEEQRGRIDTLLERIDALEKRKPAPLNAATLPFSVKDAKGRVRLLVTTDGDEDGAVMFLADGKGRPRIGFTANTDSGSIELYDEGNNAAARLQNDATGGELHLIHSDGRAVDLDGALGVRVRGKSGSSHVQLSSDGNGGHINVYGSKSDVAVIQMRAISTGAGRLTLSSPDGSYLLDAGAATDGAGILKMGPDGNGAAASMTSAGRPASTLQGRND
jgi:hypothetical protein